MTDWSFVVFLQLQGWSRLVLVPRGLNRLVTGLDQSLYITTTCGLKMLGSMVVKSYDYVYISVSVIYYSWVEDVGCNC